jgi:hypothetical protein
MTEGERIPAGRSLEPGSRVAYIEAARLTANQRHKVYTISHFEVHYLPEKPQSNFTPLSLTTLPRHLSLVVCYAESYYIATRFRRPHPWTIPPFFPTGFLLGPPKLYLFLGPKSVLGQNIKKYELFGATF